MIYDHLKPSIIIHYDVPSKTLPNTLTANTAPRPPVWVLERNPGYYTGAGRLEDKMCVRRASAVAVEAENLFFVLGGPTPYMCTQR